LGLPGLLGGGLLGGAAGLGPVVGAAGLGGGGGLGRGLGLGLGLGAGVGVGVFGDLAMMTTSATTIATPSGTATFI
jgi:hypothetical protein